MVTDWTPEEEEAWRELERRCPTKEQTLQLAQTLDGGVVYLCRFCGDYHVKPLPSPEQSV